MHGRSAIAHAQRVTTARRVGRDSRENGIMSQITKTAQVKPVPNNDTYGRGIAASLALAAAVIVAAFLLTRAPAAVPTGMAGADQLTDGFLPGAIAAHAGAADAQCPGVVRRLGGKPRWTNARRSERGSRRVGGWPDRVCGHHANTNCATGGRPGWSRRARATATSPMAGSRPSSSRHRAGRDAGRTSGRRRATSPRPDRRAPGPRRGGPAAPPGAA